MLRLHRANEQILLQVQEVSSELKDYASVYNHSVNNNHGKSREQSADSLEDMFKVDPSTLIKA